MSHTLSKPTTFVASLLAASALMFGAAASTDAEAGAPYSLNVSNGSAKVGASTTITVTVKANAGFKCNAEYPHKVKGLSAADGVDLGAKKVMGSISGKKITFSVPVTPTKAGTHAVTGQVRFSVCNDKSCHIKKLPLSASVTGK
jgi:hypothetical protein